jgi:mannosyltransferase OCH1-like enzyme
MFWAYGNLSEFERLCVESFVRLEYRVTIWTYDNLLSAPPGANVRDAREIIPEAEVFLNRQGSYAGFSDLFRYSVLSRRGGLYVDTDVFALRHVNELPRSRFLVTEKSFGSERGEHLINGNVIFNPSPCSGDVIDLALAYSVRFRKEDINWGEIGPDLLTAIVRIYPEHKYEIKDPQFANPIDYWDSPSMLLKPDVRLNRQESFFLHLYNETWKRNGVSKNVSYPHNSLMDFVSQSRNPEFKTDVFFNDVERSPSFLAETRR